MYTKSFAYKISILIALLAMFLASCAAKATSHVVVEVPASAATQAPAAEERRVEATQVVEAQKEVVVQATQALAPVAELPQPTQAPIGAERPVIEPRPTPADNFFKEYGVNPFTDTYEDHLSTFALDVDTASYTVMRRYINDGSLPPADSVRIEEFVNYFNMNYPTPPEVAFGIYADGAPSPYHTDGAQILRIGVQGYQVQSWERKPAALTFVIDISGSMERENRLEMVKRALNMLVDQLQPDDSVGIVVYGSDARVLLNPTSGSDRDTILSAIYSLRPEGSTNAAAGIRLGYDLAMQAYKPRMTNRVILSSDGVANVGDTDAQAILDHVYGYVDEGVYLTTVGFGMGNFNDVLMEQLADKGNGNYSYVDTMEAAERIFVDQLTSTLEVIALDAKTQVDFNPDVTAYYRLVGYENREVADTEFRNDTVDAGEIGAGHSVTALYEIMLRPGASGRIATVQLRWKDPQTYQVTEVNGNINTWDLSASFADTDPHYQLAVAVMGYAEILRESPWMKGISLEQVYRIAMPLSHSIPEDQDVIEFINLVDRARRLGK